MTTWCRILYMNITTQIFCAPYLLVYLYYIITNNSGNPLIIGVRDLPSCPHSCSESSLLEIRATVMF